LDLGFWAGHIVGKVQIIWVSVSFRLVMV